MLVKTIYNAESLREEFKAYNRDYYTYTAYEEMIRLFEETDYGQPTELDVIGMCGDFNEDDIEDIIDSYESSIMDYADAHGYDTSEMDEDEKINLVEDFLTYHTWAVRTEGNKYLYLAF